MLKIPEWEAGLAPSVHWKKAYSLVEVEVRAFLATCPPDLKLTTKALVEELFPIAKAKGEPSLLARRRLFKALFKCAEHGLSDCATKGELVVIMGRPARRWSWHKPDGSKPGEILALDPVPTIIDEDKYRAMKSLAIDLWALVRKGIDPYTLDEGQYAALEERALEAQLE